MRLRMRVARPMARGRKRLSVGPSSAVTPMRYAGRRRSARGCARRWRRPTRAPCSSRAPRGGAEARMARASCTDLPRMWSHTRRALRAEVRTYLAWARTTTRSTRRDALAGGLGAASGSSSLVLLGARAPAQAWASPRPACGSPRALSASASGSSSASRLGLGRVRTSSSSSRQPRPRRPRRQPSARARRSQRPPAPASPRRSVVLGRLVAHRRFPVSAWPR